MSNPYDITSIMGPMDTSKTGASNTRVRSPYDTTFPHSCGDGANRSYVHIFMEENEFNYGDVLRTNRGEAVRVEIAHHEEDFFENIYEVLVRPIHADDLVKGPILSVYKVYSTSSFFIMDPTNIVKIVPQV